MLRRDDPNIALLLASLDTVPETSLALLAIARDVALPDGTVDVEKTVARAEEIQKATAEADAYIAATRAFDARIAAVEPRR